MDTVAFSVGIVTIHWYGLIISFSVFVSLMVSFWQAWIRRESLNPIIDLAVYGIPVAIIMARIYYVMFNWQLYEKHLLESLFIWHGGLAIHGAIIGMILTITGYTFIKKMPFWYWADIMAPGFAIAQALGQWANFINQEAFGYPTDFPWGVYIDYAYRPPGYEAYDYFHPTFIYESICSLLIFLVLVICSYCQVNLKRFKTGNIFLLYILLYSLSRLFIEGLRIDSEFVGEYRLAQLVSLISIIIAIGLLVVRNNITSLLRRQ